MTAATVARTWHLTVKQSRSDSGLEFLWLKSWTSCNSCFQVVLSSLGSGLPVGLGAPRMCLTLLIDSGLVSHTLAGSLWEGIRKSRRCSRDTYPESYITKNTRSQRESADPPSVRDAARHFPFFWPPSEFLLRREFLNTQPSTPDSERAEINSPTNPSTYPC